MEECPLTIHCKNVKCHYNHPSGTRMKCKYQQNCKTVECTLDHSTLENPDTRSIFQHKKSIEKKKTVTKCLDFEKGTCSNIRCDKSHVLCKLYNAGSCSFGSRCTYVHSNKEKTISSPKSSKVQKRVSVKESNHLNKACDENTDVLELEESLEELDRESSDGSSISLQEIVKNDREFVLQVSPKVPFDPSFRVMEFVKREKQTVFELFENKEQGLKQKLKQNFKNLDKDITVYNENRLAIDSELKLLLRQRESFRIEMERLRSGRGTHVRKAYEREIRRASNPLPFYGYRSEIIEKLKINDVLILMADTGSGKSTQIVQYLLEAGVGVKGKIVCTQPRKVAAISLAKRVSEELQSLDTGLIESKVGGFNPKKQTGKMQSKLCFMTDRSLLNELQRNKLLKHYSIIIVDEAHERSLFTDILLCELKKLVVERKKQGIPLKLIITSATIDEKVFQKYFENCPVLKVPGRMYPVDVYWEKTRDDYEQQAMDRVNILIKGNISGDILVFLTNPEEVERCCKRLQSSLQKKGMLDRFEVLPLHGKLDPDDQQRVFEQFKGKHKVIFATNIAETSITIDGVTIIVDTGRAKERVFDQNRNITILRVNFISQSSAIQRKGRAGRTAPGTCYRLYEETDFYGMDMCQQPEILRSHLGLVCLQLLNFGVQDIIAYDLIDKPSKENLSLAIKKLEDLQLVKDNKITDKGVIASELCLEPSIARMIIAGIDMGVHDSVVMIAAMITVSHILYKRGTDLEAQTNSNISRIVNAQDTGDLLSLLSIMKEYSMVDGNKRKKEWCSERSFNTIALKLATQTHRELTTVLKKFINAKSDSTTNSDVKFLTVQAVCTGLHLNLAYFSGKLTDGTKVYKLVELDQEACVHPSSVVAVLSTDDGDNRYVLFNELMRTERLYMKNLTPIKLEWIKDYSRFDLSHVQSCVKEQIFMGLPPAIISILKFRNSEMLEILEEKIGSIVEVKKDGVATLVSQGDVERAKNIMGEFIEMAKQRLKTELYEYRPPGSSKTRVLIGAGMNVQTVLLNEEFVRINFKQVSTSTSDATLKSLFNMHGQVLDFRKNPSSSSKTGGYVIFSSSSDAVRAYQQLQGHFLDDSVIELCPTTSIDGGEIKSVPVLKAIWYMTNSKGTAFVTYTSRIEAEEAAQGLQAYFRGSVTVGWKKTSIGKRDGDDSTLYLSGLSPLIDDIKLKEIALNFGSTKDIHVNREDLQVSDEYEEMYAQYLHSLLSQYGTIDTLDIFPIAETKSGKKKQQAIAMVRYENQNSTDEAIEKLNERLNAFTGAVGYFYLRADLREDYFIPTSAYKMMKKDIDVACTIAKTRMNCSVTYKELSGKGNSSVIRLRASSQRILNQATDLFKNLLTPAVLTLPWYQFKTMTDKKLTFAKNTLAQEHFNQIFISKDARTKTIKVYGPKYEREEAARRLQNFIKDDNSIKKEIKVDPLKAIIQKNGELSESLKKFKGEISIDIKRSCIQFLSTNTEFEELKRTIDQLTQEYKAQKKPNATIDEQCLICFCEVEEAYRISACDHVFCSGCIKFQFDTMAADQSISCCKCKTELPLQDMRLLSHPEKFAEKCEISLNRYLLQNIGMYKYCHKCNQLARIINGEAECLTCHKTYCSFCDHDSHPGMSCEDAKSGNRGFEEWKKMFTRPCPNCKVPIEKNQGCNHMTCTSCQNHFCWLCADKHKGENEPRFRSTSSQPIHAHLNQIHGGIYTVEDLLYD